MTPHQPDPHHILKSIARLSRALRKVYDIRARDYASAWPGWRRC